MQERRKFVRFRIPLCTKYRMSEDSPEEFSAVSRDISYGGIRLLIDSNQKLPENPIFLNIIFPNRTLKLTAQLVWLKDLSGQKQEAGFVFHRVPEDYKEIIYRYILEYSPQELTSRWWAE